MLENRVRHEHEYSEAVLPSLSRLILRLRFRSVSIVSTLSGAIVSWLQLSRPCKAKLAGIAGESERLGTHRGFRRNIAQSL